jgi:hypothetical protein
MAANELMHYGVKGMKWGVHKSVYKSASRQERKNIRKEYYKTPEGKSVKATKIGTILGGPLTGIIAGLTSLKVNDIKNSKSGEKGKDKVNEMMGIDEIRNKKVSSLPKSKNSGFTVMVTADQARKMGLDNSTRITGKEESDMWKAIAREYGKQGSTNSNPKRISRKTYNKFQADDVEGVVRNMSKTQYDDVRKHVGNSMDNGDWDKVEDYIARKYS